MNGTISGVLTKKQTDELFEAESVLFYDMHNMYTRKYVYSHYVIPKYRIIELFGSDFLEWLMECHKNGCMERGADYNVCSHYGVMNLEYFYRSGFDKIVSEHNRRALIQLHEQSEAKKLIDEFNKHISDELDREDREHNEKKARRKKETGSERRIEVSSNGKKVH